MVEITVNFDYGLCERREGKNRGRDMTVISGLMRDNYMNYYAVSRCWKVMCNGESDINETFAIMYLILN